MAHRIRPIALLALPLFLLACQDDEETPARWTQVVPDIDAKSVAVSPEGGVFVTAPPIDWDSWSIYRLYPEREAWDLLDGNAFRVSAGPDGEMWGIARYAELWRRTSSVWSKVDYAKDVAIGARGQVFRLRQQGDSLLGYPVDRWVEETGTWEGIGGHADLLAVAPNGDLWIIDPNGAVRTYSGGEWTDRPSPGTAVDIAVSGDGTAYVLAGEDPAPQGIFAWKGRSWTKRIDGDGLIDIAGGPGREVYAVKRTTGAGKGVLLRTAGM